MNLPEKFLFNFIDEDGNNTFTYAKNQPLMYVYTNYKNEDSMYVVKSYKKRGDVLEFKLTLQGFEEASFKVVMKDEKTLHLHKERNGEIIADGNAYLNELSPIKDIPAFNGAFVK